MASYNFDNQPMTLIEAAAVGLPAIFCDPDMKEVVPVNGSIFCGKEPSEMGAALNELIAHPERVEKMSKAMLEYRPKVAQKAQMEKLLALYNKLV